MSSRSGFALLLIALALAAGLVGLLSPWWTVTYVPHDGDDGMHQAGPFDSGNGLVDARTALLSGSIAVSGLVALGASIAMLGFGLRANRTTAVTSAPLVALAGSALLALALVFVIFAYPNDHAPAAAFWGGDVATNEPTGFTSAGAAYGWYLGVAAVVIAGIGATIALWTRDTAQTDARSSG